MATSGFKTKESEPLYVGIADVNKEADFEIKEAMKVNTNFKKVFTKFIEVI